MVEVRFPPKAVTLKRDTLVRIGADLNSTSPGKFRLLLEYQRIAFVRDPVMN